MDIEEIVTRGLKQVFDEFERNIDELGLSQDLSKELKEYLYSKKDRILELLKRRQEIFEISRGVYRLDFLSSLALARRVESYAVVKDLSGEEKVVHIGRIPVEQAVWSTVIGVNALKCNCPDSLFNSWRSLRGLARISRKYSKQLGFMGLFDKYNLCKHTLYALSLATGVHSVKPYLRHIDILKLELIGVILYRFRDRMISRRDRDVILKYIEKILSTKE